MKRKVVVLGATGSIGKSTLDVFRQNPGDFEVVALASAVNAAGLSQAAAEFKAGAAFLKEDRDALLDLMKRGDFDTCVFALTDFELSMRALETVLSRKDRKLNVLMASKEAIVAFGTYFKNLAATNGHHLIPLDSEPSAVFQCLGGTLEGGRALKKVYLVATGGPFYKNQVRPEDITPAMALKHPIWDMGTKITIDSATLVNKSLELMEISQLFGIPARSIEILIHPQCVVHSMAEMANGTVLAQMGPADMRLPIHYGLYWPQSFEHKPAVPPLDFKRIKELQFDPPDLSRFPCLRVALERVAYLEDPDQARAARLAFLAADEVCVESFTGGKIRFTQMAGILEHVVSRALKSGGIAETDWQTGLTLYREAKRETEKEIERLAVAA